MSALRTTVTLPFAGGDFRFHLSDEGMYALETGGPDPGTHPAHRNIRRVDAAPPMRLGEAFGRLLRGRFTVEGRDVGLPGAADFSVVELNAIIRMALLGGGGGSRDGEVIELGSHNVGAFMRDYVHPMTLMERWDFCLAVLGARFEGVTGSNTDAAPASIDG